MRTSRFFVCIVAVGLLAAAPAQADLTFESLATGGNSLISTPSDCTPAYPDSWTPEGVETHRAFVYTIGLSSTEAVEKRG